MNNYAIVGMGFVYPRHREAIEKTGGNILLRCDVQHAQKYPDYIDWVEMFHSKDFDLVDTVVVLTPNYLHSTITREALRLGKQVICEKPLSIYDDYDGLEGSLIVLQLRYSKILPEIKKAIKKDSIITLKVKTYREESYWKSWKGNPNLSGGILYNMGIHYFDLLIHLLGNDYEVRYAEINFQKATGQIMFDNVEVNYEIEISKEPTEVIRKFTVDGEEFDIEGATIPLSNDTVPNLHIEVYKHALRGEGIPVSEAQKSLKLVKELSQWKNL